MAPSTRSGRGLDREMYRAHQEALRAGPVNTTGLPGLPPELIMEIISCYPAIPVPATESDVQIGPPLYTRIQVLRNLSQMCRSLRSICIPLLWRRIEVCTSPRAAEWEQMNTRTWSGHRRRLELWQKDLATELVRQLEVVTIREPALAEYVHIINLVVTKWAYKTVIPELARCMELLPNLHTFQILRGAEGGIKQDAFLAFKGKVFPRIHTLMIPGNAVDLLASCPNVRFLNCFAGYPNYYPNYWQDNMFREIVKHCHQIEELRGLLDVVSGERIPDMIQSLPKTRCIVLNARGTKITHDMIDQLSKFSELETIELELEYPLTNTSPAVVRELVKRCLSVLRSFPTATMSGRERRIVLTHRGGKFDRVLLVTDSYF